MADLVPSGLKTSGTGSRTWMDDYFHNWELLNDELLYLGTNSTQQLQDVDVTGLAEGKVLRYNAGTSKWEPWTPHRAPQTTTTTTTTTTTA